MGFSYNKIDGFVDRLATRETDRINQARIKILVYIIFAYLVFTGTLVFAYAVDLQSLQLIRVATVFVFCIFFLFILQYTNRWKIISHTVISLITLVVWSNLSIYVRGINVATLQYVWFACALSFYMHGLKWGWFYSLLNVLPLVAYVAMDNNYYFVGSGPQNISLYTYIFVVCYNFGIILFLHYYFFKAFQENFIRLTEAKNELRELNEKMKTALFDLEKLSISRMNFLSTMSHELRTPMNGVIGISNALLQDPREDQMENMAVLKFSAENLLSLINDILDFNKLESNKSELEHVPFEISALIENNFASLETKAAERQLDFNYLIDEGLNAKILVSDPTRLSQVLSNLLNNAIKFTAKGKVCLKASILNVNGDSLKIRFLIEDTGIGIEPERQKAIFEAYVQASSSTSRNYGGTGLGLPIVKKVLEMFNSEISLSSELNVGTSISFDIEFDYQDADLAIAQVPADATASVAHLRVLVAEDNHINILVIKKTLERWGIVPTIAENGIKALEKLDMADFDVILMDLQMPELDGYETAVAVRSLSDKTKSAIPIIAFTANIDHNISKRVGEAGMSDYLPKPFKPEDLLNKLRRLSVA